MWKLDNTHTSTSCGQFRVTAMEPPPRECGVFTANQCAQKVDITVVKDRNRPTHDLNVMYFVSVKHLDF